MYRKVCFNDLLTALLIFSFSVESDSNLQSCTIMFNFTELFIGIQQFILVYFRLVWPEDSACHGK